MLLSNGNRLKQSLKAGKKTCGAWLVTGSSTVAEIMALAGFDWLLIDCEHAPIDFQTLLFQAQAINSTSAIPLVRVPENNKTAIKRVLDIGVDGIIIPSVNNEKEAIAAVAACKYPPLGERGMASTITRAASYGLDGSYIKSANNNIVVILQIESKEAVENINKILTVSGIDAIFIGPTDLAADMNHAGDADNEEVLCAIRKVENAAKQAKIPIGRAASNWQQAKSYFERGYCFVSLCADAVILSRTVAKIVGKFREEVGGKKNGTAED